MKILSRDFTPREKIMLAFLLLILVALCWYRFLYVPCTEAIETAEIRQGDLELELLQAQIKEAKLKQMQDEIESLGELSETSRMGSYNNSKAELTLLNGVLESAGDYTVSFSGVTRNGDQIRRKFSLVFTADSFEQVESIIAKLTQSEYRCLMGDLAYGPTNVNYRKEAYHPITVRATATFFETMYDGEADAGLPEDEAASGKTAR